MLLNASRSMKLNLSLHTALHLNTCEILCKKNKLEFFSPRLEKTGRPGTNIEEIEDQRSRRQSRERRRTGARRRGGGGGGSRRRRSLRSGSRVGCSAAGPR